MCCYFRVLKLATMSLFVMLKHVNNYAPFFESWFHTSEGNEGKTMHTSFCGSLWINVFQWDREIWGQEWRQRGWSNGVEKQFPPPPTYSNEDFSGEREVMYTLWYFWHSEERKISDPPPPPPPPPPRHATCITAIGLMPPQKHSGAALPLECAIWPCDLIYWQVRRKLMQSCPLFSFSSSSSLPTKQLCPDGNWNFAFSFK